MTNRRPLPKVVTECVVGLATVVLFLTSAVPMASAAPFAYVASGSSAVSVIDGATNSVVTTVNVGSTPFGVATRLIGGRGSGEVERLAG